MGRHRAIGLALFMGGLFAGPAPATSLDGLIALKQFNLIVRDDLNAQSQHVQGRTFVGNNLSATGAVFGQGNGSQGSAASAYGPLTVVGNATGSMTLTANGQNGANPPLGNVVKIGGNAGAVEFNGSGNTALRVGKNLLGPMNVNQNDVRYGGATAGNNPAVTGAVRDAGLATLGATLGSQRTTLIADLQALSVSLKNLPAIATIASAATALDYAARPAGQDYAVFTIADGTAFFAQQNADLGTLFKNVPTIGGVPVTTIINVLGSGAITQSSSMNFNSAALNGHILWNFVDATSITLNSFHGSIVAPKASLTNTTSIEGSVYAASATLGGEVHLSAYNGSTSFLAQPPAVPEPATWAQMLLGFGLIGGLVRRRRTAAAAAA